VESDDVAVGIRRIGAAGLALLAGLALVGASGSADLFFSHARALGAQPAQCANPLPTPPARPTPHVQCVIAPWFVLEVGADHRSLLVQSGPVASCSDFVGSAGSQIRETSKGLDIRMVQLMRVTGYQDGCVRREVLHLPQRLRGQKITGEHWSSAGPFGYLHRWVSDPPYSREAVPLVPRIVGLSVTEAQALLAREGFHSRVRGTGHAVTSQHPRRGLPAPGSTRTHPDGGTVTIET
jgi:hypothetical protein